MTVQGKHKHIFAQTWVPCQGPKNPARVQKQEAQQGARFLKGAKTQPQEVPRSSTAAELPLAGKATPDGASQEDGEKEQQQQRFLPGGKRCFVFVY